MINQSFLHNKKKGLNGTYFLGLATVGLGFTTGLGFVSLIGFIGAPQQTKSHSAQPQSSSTKITSPHSSHLYFSPFFFAKKFTSKKSLLLIIGFLRI
jgi:hypothetical protein